MSECGESHFRRWPLVLSVCIDGNWRAARCIEKHASPKRQLAPAFARIRPKYCPKLYRTFTSTSTWLAIVAETALITAVAVPVAAVCVANTTRPALTTKSPAPPRPIAVAILAAVSVRAISACKCAAGHGCVCRATKLSIGTALSSSLGCPCLLYETFQVENNMIAQ